VQSGDKTGTEEKKSSQLEKKGKKVDLIGFTGVCAYQGKNKAREGGGEFCFPRGIRGWYHFPHKN